MIWNEDDETRIRQRIREAEDRIGRSAVHAIRRVLRELTENRRKRELNENRLESFFSQPDDMR